MALYHLSLKIISRGKGKSAVAAAAYRSGEKITNQYDGVTHDYSRKRGVVHTEILLPDNAPKEYADRSTLWNAVEKIEKASNSRLARDIDVALPVELSTEQQQDLIREYCRKAFVQHGMVADICIHDKNDGNPHAHIMLTVRPFTEEKTWGEKQKKVYQLDSNGEKIYDPKKKQYKCKTVKLTDWDNGEKVEEWRKAWADNCNEYLSRNNTAERIDHRSYKRQGKTEQPTIHLGAAAYQMEKRGIRTERGDINRNIKINNREIKELKKQLYQIDKWLKEQEENAEPTLAETINNVMQKRQSKQHKPAFSELTKAANLINFITKNDINDYENLHEKVNQMHERLYTVRQTLKSTESRLKELNENLQQAVHYRQNKAVFETYNSIQIGRIDKLLKRDPKMNFYEANRTEIALFQIAERYLKKYLKSDALPVKAWKLEVAELTAKKDELYKQYYKLKDDVNVIDDVKREVDEIVRVDMVERVSKLEERQWRDRGVER